MNPYVAVVIAALVVVVVVVLIARSRRSRDGVDSFRRQIDALSPEARRPVVDQVQSAANRIETRPVDDTTDDSAATDDPDTDDPDTGDADGGDPAGGARGA